ncbi:uncharacterized protein LOC113296509 [Papaver somniferum]|uniref:uncharacterized protein LOC113296509 n=1 Tax=Papaver somniferum TaxID=3469 RepID=UPI000E6FBB5D|nr:uncharacterized protein LOC113296509 [Papaver somniferum]
MKLLAQSVVQSNQKFDDSVQMSQHNQQNNAQAISNLETQISQLSNRLNDKEDETFPSQTTPNPKGVNQGNRSGSSNHNEHVRAVITLRSGKTLENSAEPPKDSSPAAKETEVDQTFPKDPIYPESAKSPSEEATPERVYIPPAPFPQRLAKKKPSTYAEILDIFKQVKIKLPLLDAIKHVPTIVKFLKEMCTIKRDASVHKKAFLTQQVSSIISQKYPIKFKYPGCPTVTCVIGKQTIDNALLDLGSSVNLLPFSVYEQLGLGEMKPTRITLQLAGRSVKIPREIIEDVLVQESRLVSVFREHKNAIGWTITDLKGISPADCMHHIYLEEGAKTSREMQRRLNPNMKEVVRTEVLKLLYAGIIYPIYDSKWVIPVQVVPKKSGITVVANENDELIPTRVTTGWRVCTDYRKMNSASRKDHFTLPFIDQMLERLAGHSHYCFLDGYSGYNQIPIAPEDQEKTTFTCPFDTFAYRHMPFGLCNAPATFQRCMLSIFSDMVD